MRSTIRTAPRHLLLLLPLAMLAAGCAEEVREEGDFPLPDSVPRVPSAADTGTSNTGDLPADSAPRAATGGSEGWRMAPILGGGAPGQPALTDVRAARHDGHDRIVFEFDSAVPGYEIRHVEEPVACGSGHPVDPGAPSAVEVEFRSAVAHDQEGRATVRDREMQPGYPTLRTARISCDFEGVVVWVLGVDRPAPVRVLELSSPARLVIDLRHR